MEEENNMYTVFQ